MSHARDRNGPLDYRETIAVPNCWRVVAEQFRAPDGSWRWDVYLTPVVERLDMIEQALKWPRGMSDFSHIIPDWETRRERPRIPLGPNVYDDPSAEVARLVELARHGGRVEAA